MTLPTFSPPIAPAPGLRRKPEVRLRVAEFGEGYTQITRDLNHIRKVETLEWPVLTVAQANQIVGFLEERGGDQPFLYRLPDDPSPIKLRIPAIVGAHSTRSWAPIPFHRGRAFHVIVGGRVGRRRHWFRPGFPGQG
jgi:phage-related protein